jgi:hypothetical protein
MSKIAMSPAAASLLRILIARGRVARARILLTAVDSVDWRSLTFGGERHRISLRATGAGSCEAVDRMCDGLEDAEFSIPGLVVADIAVVGARRRPFDGSTEITIEALTISDD